MPSALMILGAVFVGLVALGAVALFLMNHFTRKAALAKFNTHAVVRIADAPDGQLVRLVGAVKLADKHLAAPITERPCAAWFVAVGQLQKNDRGQWMANPYEIGDKRHATAFALEDESGVAWIEAADAEVLIVHEPVKHENEDEPAIRARLDAGRGEINIRKGPCALRFQEGVVEPGERVSVVGLACWEDDVSAMGEGYRGGGRRLVLRAPEGDALRVSDDPEAMG